MAEFLHHCIITNMLYSAALFTALDFNAIWTHAHYFIFFFYFAEVKT